LNARSSYLAGFSGTSHVEAARRLGIGAVGTMAHAWVQSFGDEQTAFTTFARLFPRATTLLVDTYDTDQGVRIAASIEPPIQAIRIDSGDLVEASKSARSILDSRDRSGVKILVSNDLDETKIDDLLQAGAPIDAFGVGTELITSRDAPAISMVYKLVELDGVGRIKKSAGKRTYPMAKQVYRATSSDGKFLKDRVTRADETFDGDPLLSPVIQAGQLVARLPDLDEIRNRCQVQRESLPDRFRQLEADTSYPIEYSEALEHEAIRLGLK
jgi:nicotinate phosphoribosyltransferase